MYIRNQSLFNKFCFLSSYLAKLPDCYFQSYKNAVNDFSALASATQRHIFQVMIFHDALATVPSMCAR